MRVLLLALAATCAVASLAAQQRAISDSDLFALRWVASPQISPDGRQAAYVLVTVNAKHDGYETSLRLVGTDGAAPPRRPTAEDLAKKDTTDKPKSDVRIITQAEFRGDDEGYLDPAPLSHIWTVPAGMPGDEPAKARQVTTGAFEENAPQWSRDGARIYFGSDRVPESYYYPPDNNVYSVPAAGGALDTVVDINGPAFGFALGSDGKSVAFRGWINPRAARSYNQADLFVWRDGRATNLTADYDFDIGSDVIGDQAPPRGGGASPTIWTADGKAVILATTEHGRSNLVRFDAQSGAREPLTTGDHAILAYTATPDARRLVLTMGDPTHLADLYALDPQTKRVTQLTHVNDSLFAKLQLVTPEDFWYSSFDGRKIETWIMKPVGFTPGKKYPLILNIHGGPHTAYGYIFFHEMQLMAARGYVVVYPNPRGS